MHHLLSDLEFTHWTWMIALAVFLGLEMAMPGIVFLWLAIASGVMAAVVFILPDMSWEWQMVWFSILSVISVFMGRQFIRKHGEIPSENENLNRRSAALVGRTVKVASAIQDGRGKVKVGDSLWTALGPDAAEGTKVVIKSATSTELHVEPASE
ncbi:NfeD family protein [Kordiimonas marina]|uniref:NfeD family protein n=1 Tax=Kordiimonas marina TaxID=2872312 RepID=UPI001FF25437|nr:NfeD family protein [Kordiimonas marina]MCJ9428875.1 NfeD family protein [Kordiimonas marina]